MTVNDTVRWCTRGVYVDGIKVREQTTFIWKAALEVNIISEKYSIGLHLFSGTVCVRDC